MGTHGAWNLTNAGPPLQNGQLKPPTPVASGKAQAFHAETWHTLALTVQRSEKPSLEADVAHGSLDGKSLLSDVQVRGLDAGFAAIGANGWFPIEYRNLSISQAERGWEAPSSCPLAKVGSVLGVRPCARNGQTSKDQEWSLLPSYQLQHQPTRLCATASAAGNVTLQECDYADQAQLFVNDYTRIRNTVTSLTVASSNQPLAGVLTGQVSVGKSGDWKSWSYFPNTAQLRNQYVADMKLGYPMCLAACGVSETTHNIVYA